MYSIVIFGSFAVMKMYELWHDLIGLGFDLSLASDVYEMCPAPCLPEITI